MVKKVSLVLDANVIISSLVFDGNPGEVLALVRKKEVRGVLSPILIAEIEEVLIKKFNYELDKLKQIINKLEKTFHVVQPLQVVEVARDVDDNRVLEAAVAGKCDFIITGDEDLLILKKYKKIQIMTATEFLEEVWRG